MLRTAAVAMVAVGWLAAFCASVAAQDRLLFVRYSQLVEADASPEALGAVRRAVDIPLLSDSPLVSISGGRFVAAVGFGPLPGGRRLYVVDTQTGTSVAVPGLTVTEQLSMVADGWRPRLFAWDSGRLWLVDVPSLTATELAGVPGAPPTFMRLLPRSRLTYAPAADILFFTRSTANGSGTELVAMHVATRAVRRLATLAGRPESMYVRPDASRVFMMGRGGGTHLAALDPATGVIVSSVSFPAYLPPLLIGDERRQRLLVKTSSLPAGSTLASYDFNLNPLRATAFEPGFDAVASTKSGRVIVASKQSAPGPTHARHVGTRLTMVDGSTGDTLSSSGVFAAWGELVPYSNGIDPSPGWLLQSPPAPPGALAATVSGRRVSLTWSNPGDTLHYDVEVGSASNQRNLLVTSVAESAFGADDVPPGMYYVRVRAVNHLGRSLPSNEIIVAVR